MMSDYLGFKAEQQYRVLDDAYDMWYVLSGGEK